MLKFKRGGAIPPFFLILVSVLFLSFQKQEGSIENINKLIREKRYKKAEEIIRKDRREGKTDELKDYLFIYVFFKQEIADSIIYYSNEFLKKYPESKYKVNVLYMLAKGYEKKRFSIRAFETYIEILNLGESVYYKDARKKVIELAKNVTLKDILRNLSKVQNLPVYPEILSVAFDKARQEGDVKAQEEIYTILREYFPEYEKTKEAEKIFKRKKKFLPFFRERKGNIFLYLPISGPDSIYGKDFLRGFKLAFKDENSLRIFDTRGEPVYTHRLLEEHFNYFSEFSIFVGPLLRKNVYLALPYFSRKRDRVFIVPSLSYVRAGEFGNNIINLSNSIYQEVKAIVERFITPNNFDSICVLVPETEEGESIYSLLYDLLSPKYGSNVLFLTFSPDTLDFQPKIDSMMKFFNDTLGPDLIIFPTGTDEALLSLASQVVFKGLKSLIITTGKFTSEDFALKSNRYIEEKVIFASAGLWDRAIAEKFLNEFRNTYNTYPGEAAYIGYDIGSLLSFAYERNMTGALSFLNFLYNLSVYKGAYKFYLFDRNGYIFVKFYRIKDKRFFEIEY